MVIRYTNESNTLNSANIDSAKHVVEIDLNDDIEECTDSGEEENNAESPASSLPETLIVSKEFFSNSFSG